MTNKPISNNLSAYELILQQAEKNNLLIAEALFDELSEDAKLSIQDWLQQTYAIRNDWPVETLHAFEWMSNHATTWYAINYSNL